ncbi:MAG: hypothetical protein JKX69_11165 [Rhodobacteraceae bacterium]|nr:hypothetical protein [Paracoccaceae bacterium]
MNIKDRLDAALGAFSEPIDQLTQVMLQIDDPDHRQRMDTKIKEWCAYW